jgi:hypothetical protein
VVSSHVSFDRYSNDQLFRSWLEDMVDYQLSGAVEARTEGATVPLGGPKRRCVLAVLLANHGTVVPIRIQFVFANLPVCNCADR